MNFFRSVFFSLSAATIFHSLLWAGRKHKNCRLFFEVAYLLLPLSVLLAGAEVVGGGGEERGWPGGDVRLLWLFNMHVTSRH